MPKVSIGLDLSLTATGVAVLSDDQEKAIHTEVIATKTTKDTIVATVGRLHTIRDRISLLTKCYQPDIVVIEAPSFGSRNGKQHERGGLWWLTASALYGLDLGAILVKVAPQTRAKYATSKGNSAKGVVLEAVQNTYTADTITDHNVADAYILAAMGLRYIGTALPKEQLTTAQLEAIKAVHL